MTSTGTPREILAGTLSDVERISAIGAGRRSAVQRELEGELRDAQRNLARRLRGVSRQAGGLGATFTEANAVMFQQHTAAAIGYVRDRLGGLTQAQAEAAAQRAITRTVRTMEALELRFTGIARPLRIRQAEQMRALTQGAQSSLLAQMPTSLDRYGQRMIGQLERIMRVGMLQGATMDEMIGALTGHGGPRGRVSLRATVTPSGVMRLVEADIPEGLFRRHRYWAERIVRTETIRAYNGASMGTMQAMRATDFPDLKKKIVAIMDSRTAADSIAVHGQVRAMNDYFVDGEGRTYLYPPARPNDRETVIPWREAWADAVAGERAADRVALGDVHPPSSATS